MADRGHYIAIEGVNGGTDYTLSGGTLRGLNWHGGSPGWEDSIDGNTVKGHVGGGTDAYEYWGSRELTIDKPENARVYLKKQGSDDVEELTDGIRKQAGVQTRSRDVNPRVDLPDDYSKVGEKAGARNTDRSNWDRVELRDDDPDNLAELVETHGERTVFELWGSQTLDNDVLVETDHVAFIGKGTEETVLTIDRGAGAVFQFGRNNNLVSDIHIRNIDLALPNAYIGDAIFKGFVEGEGIYIKDVEVYDEIKGPGSLIQFEAAAGAGVDCERVVVSEGANRHSDLDSTEDSIGAILSGRSDGFMRLEDCEWGGFPNNSTYAEPPKHGNDGRIYAINCEFYDSDRGQVRGGGTSMFVGCTLYADTQKPGFNNLRGAWIRWADGVVIADCTIKTHTSDMGPGIYIDSTAGSVTIQDCDIECRSSHKAARGIYASSPDQCEFGDTSVHVLNTRIHGDGQPKNALRVDGRPGSTFTDVGTDVSGAREDQRELNY